MSTELSTILEIPDQFRGFCIYKHTSPNGKSYIGQTKNYSERVNRHQRKSNRCTAFYFAIKKYTWETFVSEILEDNLTIDEANFWEEFYISEHKTLSPNGYNLRTGGGGREITEEARLNMSLAHKGQVFSEERKLQMSLERKGKKISEETKLKISIANKGRPVSDETKLKQSIVRKGRILTVEHKLKISKGNKGRVFDEETRLKISIANKGRIPNEEERSKMSIANKGRIPWNKGIPMSEEIKKNYLKHVS